MKIRATIYFLMLAIGFAMYNPVEAIAAKQNIEKVAAKSDIKNILTDSEVSDLKSCVEQNDRFVITCHVAPDGDAIGSSLGLMYILNALGKNAMVVAPDVVRESLRFLPGIEGVIEYPKQKNIAKKAVDGADCIICLDFNSLNRNGDLGPIINASKAKKVMIDHHLNPEKICDLIISYSAMSSTCELIYRVASELGWADKIDYNAAECLYTGMMTDTGNFAFASSDPDFFRIIAKLLEKGIKKDEIYQEAMNTSSFNRLKFMGHILQNNITIYPESNGALMYVSKDDFAQYGCDNDDTVGLANLPLKVPEVKWAIFLIETDGRVFVSARSKGDFAVNTICKQYFNGGGHKNAAGGSIEGSLKDAIEVFEKVEAAVKSNQIK